MLPFRMLSAMKNIPIPADLFVENRRRLVERLPPDSLVITHSNDIMPTNADGTMGFHQNADLFYLSGINQEESILLLAPNALEESLREVLFLREPNEHLTIWEGHKLSREQAQAASGVRTVKWLSEFRGVWHALMCEAEHVYLNANEHPRAEVECRKRYRVIPKCYGTAHTLTDRGELRECTLECRDPRFEPDKTFFSFHHFLLYLSTRGAVRQYVAV